MDDDTLAYTEEAADPAAVAALFALLARPWTAGLSLDLEE